MAETRVVRGVDARLAFGACAACRGRGALPAPPPAKASALAKWERKLAARAHAPPGKVLPPLPPRPPPPPPPEPVPCAACAGRGVVALALGGIASGHAVCPAQAEEELPLIAIVGGGLGGLACALALQQRGARVAVFERDPSFEARAQGYGLTIQQVRVRASRASDRATACAAGARRAHPHPPPRRPSLRARARPRPHSAPAAGRATGWRGAARSRR